jgi:3-oxoacyl-[acyl-carrier-protein] synthase-3
MKALIEATGVSVDPTIQSSIAHAAYAARECLKAAGLPPSEVDLLINVGVFRDDNMVEPGIAAMIQKGVGMNLDYCEGANAATSFDLMNSGCGALNAIQVAGAFLATKSARRVLVVSSDAHPSNVRTRGFPFATMGAAMLLRASSGADEESAGFGPVRTSALKENFPGISATVPRVTGAHHALDVQVHPEFAARALTVATELVRAYVDTEKVDLATTLLVSSHPTPSFAAQLAKSLAIAEDGFVSPGALDGDPHSSALTWGYHVAHARGIAPKFTSVLFVGVGAGLSAVCAVYRR